jgi:hypothetical protein
MSLRLRRKRLKKLLLAVLLFGALGIAQAQTPDNRYCGAGNVWTGGISDGPAALPQSCLNTASVNTPSPGSVIPVVGSLLTAYNAAQCGDTLVVPHGTVYSVPPAVTFAAKGCDDQHWITIKSDGTLPAEGVRVSPKDEPQMFKFVLKGSATVAVQGDHIRFIGMEAAMDPTGGATTNLLSIQGGNHIIVDRSYFHGLPGNKESRRGMGINGGTYIGVVESWFEEFHCIAVTGSCSDAQAILLADTTLPEGTIAIKNNYLVGAAETILAGGSQQGATVPSDVEIRRNTMTKPMNWNPSDPSFIGPQKYIVKNLFELKNAQRVLFEGNQLSNCWGGFSQVGWASVFTPRGTWASVQDITYRYNVAKHVGAGWQIAASKAGDNGVDSAAAQRFSFHDNEIDDIDNVHYNGSGWSLQITSGLDTNPPLNNVLIDHNLIHGDPDKTLLIVGANPANPKLPFNITITSNVFEVGKFPVWSMGGTNGVCASKNQPLTTFNQCWNPYTFTGNTLLLEDNKMWPWPDGNDLVLGGFSRLNERSKAMQ